MAREWQEEAKRAYDWKFAEVAEAEKANHDAIKRTLEKTDALEKHVKTVTMNSDSLAATEADFLQTLTERRLCALSLVAERGFPPIPSSLHD